MTKGMAKRAATAQGRLRRMETLIGPYTEDVSLQRRIAREEWLPGDHAHISKKGLAAKAKYRRPDSK